MDQEVKQAIYMGIQLIVSSTVIAVIALAVITGKGLIKIRDQEEHSGKLIAEQTIFSEYMNEQGNISCSDVIDIIITYAKIYDFAIIDRSSGKATIPKPNDDKVFLSSDPLDDFNRTNVAKKLQMYNTSKFKMQQVLTSDGYAIQAIVFTTGGSGSCTTSELENIKKNTFGIVSESSYK